MMNLDVLFGLVNAWQIKQQARKTERRRKAELERLAKQIEIGDRIYCVLLSLQSLTGWTHNRRIARISNFNLRGIYRIEIQSVDSTQFSEEIAAIMIDLRWPKRKQLFVGCQIFGVFEKGPGSRTFSIAEGRRFIEDKLVPVIFPRQT
jgi:hypothetical protein